MERTSHAVSDQLVAAYAQDGWARFLGIELNPGDGAARLRLPYDTRLLNADGGVVHGGILASLLLDAARLEVATVWGNTTDLAGVRPLDGQIVYLRPAREVDVVASAQLLRAGRTLAFVASEIRDPQGQVIAQAQWVFARSGDESVDAAPLPETPSLADNWRGEVDAGRIGALLETNMKKRLPGLTLCEMGAGRCVIEVSNTPELCDVSGALAAGVQLLTCDNVGVFAGFGLNARITRMSTAALKLTFIAPPRGEALIVVGSSLGKAGFLIANQSRVYGRETGRLYAFGTVTLAT